MICRLKPSTWEVEHARSAAHSTVCPFSFLFGLSESERGGSSLGASLGDDEGSAVASLEALPWTPESPGAIAAWEWASDGDPLEARRTQAARAARYLAPPRPAFPRRTPAGVTAPAPFSPHARAPPHDPAEPVPTTHARAG